MTDTPVQVLTVRDKIARWLTDMKLHVNLEENGAYTLRVGSTRAWVRVVPWRESSSLVYLSAPIILQAPSSAELFHYVATNADSYNFGHLSAHEDENGVMILFSHTLLGDYLDFEEFQTAIIGIAGTADSIDNELQGRFGGTTFHDEPES